MRRINGKDLDHDRDGDARPAADGPATMKPYGGVSGRRAGTDGVLT